MKERNYPLLLIADITINESLGSQLIRGDEFANSLIGTDLQIAYN